MNDTQWPRFYVFKQDATDGPHQNCGSIHAPDGEMALLNARDVFVRRPPCVSLWVLPADAIHRHPPSGPPLKDHGKPRPRAYAVFVKADHRQPHHFAGELEADTAQEALDQAVSEQAHSSWVELWVAPASQLVRSDREDADAWFGPAYDKPYRHGSFYHTESAMRKLMSASADDEA